MRGSPAVIATAAMLICTVVLVSTAERSESAERW